MAQIDLEDEESPPAEVQVTPEAYAKIQELEESWPGAEELILDAFKPLARHPMMGPQVVDDLRRQIIGKGKYVALYQYYETLNLVLVLAVRHHRESGFY